MLAPVPVRDAAIWQDLSPSFDVRAHFQPATHDPRTLDGFAQGERLGH
jgi:hypothetical protein